MGTGVMMGVLPGGTGNGFGTELGIPHDLDAAVRVLCTSHNVRHVDIAQYNEDFTSSSACLRASNLRSRPAGRTRTNMAPSPT
jgi:diacylglycerol kinase family enzyme